MNREQMIGKAAATAARARRGVTARVNDTIGVVVRSAGGTIAARFDAGHGVVFGVSEPFPWRALQLPPTVIWRPES